MIFTFSGKFASEADLLAHRKQQLQSNLDLQTLSQKLAALKTLSSNWNRDDSEGSFGEALAADAAVVREEKGRPEKDVEEIDEEWVEKKPKGALKKKPVGKTVLPPVQKPPAKLLKKQPPLKATRGKPIRSPVKETSKPMPKGKSRPVPAKSYRSTTFTKKKR
jgi:hypothetical protein